MKVSKQPLLSIITVNLNNLEGLRRTVNSVLSQTCKEFEYLIIDGGSTDGSREFIEGYAEEVDYWVSEPDTGIYNAMNKGIRAANGEYLLFLNSGDWFYDDSVLSNIGESFNGEEKFLYGDIIKILENGTEILEKGKNDITLKTFLEGSLNHQALFINRKVFDIFGLYDEKYSIVSDWKLDLLALGLNTCSLKRLDQIIAYYPLDGISMNYKLRDDERKRVIEEVIPLSILRDYEMFAKQKVVPPSNRFKMVLEMENYKLARKLNSTIFRILLVFFTGKRLKDLK